MNGLRAIWVSDHCELIQALSSLPSLRGVTGLPDNFPIQQIARLFFK